MSKVRVNGEFTVDGEFSFSVSYDTTQNPPVVSIEGAFTSSAGYMPEIHSLENERYILTGVRVHQEGFGSEENAMVYNFAAKSFGIADALREVKYSG